MLEKPFEGDRRAGRKGREGSRGPRADLVTPALPGTGKSLQASVVGGYAVAHTEAVLPSLWVNQITQGLPTSWDAGATRSEICLFPHPSLMPNLCIANLCPYLGINACWGQRATAQGPGYLGPTVPFVILLTS